MKLALLMILSAAAAFPQSGIAPAQVKAPATPAVFACATVGSGVRCDFARLDPSVQVTVDAQGVMTIKASGSSPAVLFTDGEVPQGAVNGTNAVFTLAATPAAGSLHLYRNGLLLKAGTDYTLAGTQITFGPNPLSIPEVGALLIADYRR